jgi:hypothetical protein
LSIDETLQKLAAALDPQTLNRGMRPRLGGRITGQKFEVGRYRGRFPPPILFEGTVTSHGKTTVLEGRLSTIDMLPTVGMWAIGLAGLGLLVGLFSGSWRSFLVALAATSIFGAVGALCFVISRVNDKAERELLFEEIANAIDVERPSN